MCIRDSSQFRAMLQQIQEQDKEERRQEREEAEKWQYEKHNRENGIPEGRKKEFSRQADNVKTFVQEDTTAKFVLLRMRGEFVIRSQANDAIVKSLSLIHI